jgi:two-component sensor histidine kinase
MTVHELATNAAKYGAFSTPGGKVQMTWTRSPEGSITIRRTELDGPLVTPPTRKSFGSEMMNSLIQQ